MKINKTIDIQKDYCGTSFAADFLGLSITAIQTLVEKNELMAWKTPGGHRRISIDSLREYKFRNNIFRNIDSITLNRRLRVLLAEDDSNTRETLQKIFQNTQLPIDCTAVSSGIEVLLDISSMNPDILIADLNMPGVDGFELVRKIKNSPQYKDLIILAISALKPEEIEDRGGLPENIIFKSKPIRLEWFDGFFAGLRIKSV